MHRLHVQALQMYTKSPYHLGYASRFTCVCVFAGKIHCLQKEIHYIEVYRHICFSIFFKMMIVLNSFFLSFFLSFLCNSNAMCVCLSNCCVEPKLCGNMLLCAVDAKTRRKRVHCFVEHLCANTDEIGAFCHHLPWRTHINCRRRHRLLLSFQELMNTETYRIQFQMSKRTILHIYLHK